MDLADIRPSDRTIEILHPKTDEPIGLRVTMVSMDDDRMKRLRREITNRSQKLAQKQKSFSAEEIDENANRILYTATTGWEWYNPTSGDSYDPEAQARFNGEVPEFTQRNFLEVIKSLAWVKRQLSDELDEMKDFFAN